MLLLFCRWQTMFPVFSTPTCDFLEHWTVSAAFLCLPGSILGFFFQVWHNGVTKLSSYFSWNCWRQLAHPLKKMPQLDLGCTALCRQVGGANLIFFLWIWAMYSNYCIFLARLQTHIRSSFFTWLWNTLPPLCSSNSVCKFASVPKS